MVRFPGDEITAAGTLRKSSVFLEMRDGVKIATDIWLPQQYQRNERLPVIISTTRYWRAHRLRWGMRALLALHKAQLDDLRDTDADYFNQRSFVFVTVDERGSGASGGRRFTEFSRDEISDMGEVEAWVARQSWSNGNIGSFGESYVGDTAELSAVSSDRATKAVTPLFSHFDVWQLVFPGGLYCRALLRPWARTVATLDRNDVCALEGVSGWRCWWLKQADAGPAPASGETDKHLEEFIAVRHNQDIAAQLERTEFRDDPMSLQDGTAVKFSEMSSFGHRDRIESSEVSMDVECGWLDANTCDGAVSRFLTFRNPQTLTMGPCSHGCAYNTDPFAEPAKRLIPDPTQDQRYSRLADFFNRTLRVDQPTRRIIRYYTMGEGAWHETDRWPPQGFDPTTRFYFAERNSLSQKAPKLASDADRYSVDFSTSAGVDNRWVAEVTGGDINYADRLSQDKKSLVYTSPPLTDDAEVTGSPVLTLRIASTTPDCAIFAYLEDVAPNGKVTYLDEGEIRAINRRVADPNTLPYEVPGIAHSYSRSDARPLIPGRATEIKFSLWTTSLVIRKDHRIRLALAGADDGVFQRYPEFGNVSWTVYTGTSFLDLPLSYRK